MSRKSKKRRFGKLCNKYVEVVYYKALTIPCKITVEDKLLIELIKGADLDILYINSIFRNRFKRRLKTFKIIC